MFEIYQWSGQMMQKTTEKKHLLHITRTLSTRLMVVSRQKAVNDTGYTRALLWLVQLLTVHKITKHLPFMLKTLIDIQEQTVRSHKFCIKDGSLLWLFLPSNYISLRHIWKLSKHPGGSDSPQIVVIHPDTKSKLQHFLSAWITSWPILDHQRV